MSILSYVNVCITDVNVQCDFKYSIGVEIDEVKSTLNLFFTEYTQCRSTLLTENLRERYSNFLFLYIYTITNRDGKCITGNLE